MEHRNMPPANTRGYTKRQMGQTSPENEREHTRNQAKRMEIHTPGGKRSSNAHKSIRETKRKGGAKYKEKDDEERRLTRERNGQQAERDQKGAHDNERHGKNDKKGNDLNVREKEDANPQRKKGSQQQESAKQKTHLRSP